jgi:hypothetical protein
VRVPARGVAPARYGRLVGGQCSCPTCGTATAAAPVVSAPAPAYCRCCGQVIR